MNTIDHKTKHSDRNWDELSLENDPVVFRELLKTYSEGHIEELGEALEKCYDASVKWTRHELWDFLKDLMEKVILVKYSDEYRTQEHWEKICRLRSEINEHVEDNDFLNEKNIIEEWNGAFSSAKKLASIYIPAASNLSELSREDVFETIY